MAQERYAVTPAEKRYDETTKGKGFISVFV
jgi:hypothetical protein